MSSSATNPGTLFGGTWEQITDRMIMAAGSSYAVGTTGGTVSHTHTSAAHTHTSAAHTHTTAGHVLTIAEMPSHTHGIYYDPNFCAAHTGNNNSWKQGLVNVDSPGAYYTNIAQPYTGGSASHSHGNTGSTTPGATGSTTPGNTGSSSNLPPYIVAYIWRRTA